MNMKRLFPFSFIFIAAISTWCPGKTLTAAENNSSDTAHAIVFISDTQAPMWFEKIFVKTHRNEEATKILLNAVERDSTVSSVFLLGDITAMSSFNSNWGAIDSFLTRFKVQSRKAYAAAGNHDYLLSSKEGENNLKKRFPDFNRTGYSIRDGSLAVVLLNSNFNELTKSEEVLQKKWYNHELDSLERDSTITMVAVGCHHSPYSNSTIVGYSQKVRDEFVQPFMNSRKCRLFLSGHAHTFQYFKDTVADKHFLVIGGGGGLLHTLSPGDSSELQDQIRWDATYRMFHFVRCYFTNMELHISVMMLSEELTGPKSVYEISIPMKNK
jgi:predicted phosphodiesterase